MVIPELNNSTDKSRSPIDQNIDTIVDNFNYPRQVKRVKFIIGRPKVSFQENCSNLRTKSWKNITVAVSFVSIMGPKSTVYDIETLHMSYKYNYVLKTLCHILGKNFSCMQKLMKSEDFVKKVKPVFKVILQNYLDKFVPTLVNFAKNNKVLGDWILTELLDGTVDSTSASLLAQVILSNKQKNRNRLSKLHEKIFEKLGETLSSDKKGQKALDDSLSLMIEVYADCVQKIENSIKNDALESKSEEKDDQMEIVEADEQEIVEIDTNVLTTLLKGIEKFPSNSRVKKLTICILNMQNVIFDSKIANKIKEFTGMVVQKILEKNYNFVDIVSILALASTENSQSILDSQV